MDIGLNDPQVPAGAQLQVTPLAAVSLETVAEIVAVPLATMDEGGGVDKTTKMGCGPEELPPPQPVRKARASMPKKGILRFIATPVRN